MPDDGVSARRRGTLPEKIGRYRIVRSVGRGAMGVVYAAQDELMGRLVALKVLMADLEGDPETLARFHREAQAAARLLHPNIIRILDAGEDQGRSFIAMELLEGWPLAEYLKRPDAAALERKLDLMVQICEGLAAAHSQGVIHRDLKPNNLFVQTDGLLKIFDFGVARLAESSMTAAGTMIGTPDYMSPEQARGAQVDARSDIFSAGAVFYSILAGRKPFPGPDLPAVLHQLQYDEPAPLSQAGAPPDLSAVVMRAMAKDPGDRPPRIQDLLAGLVRFRRQYQAETRRLAATARTRFEAVERFFAAVRDAASALGMPGDDAAASLAERFPLIATAGGAGFDAVSFDRARVTSVLHELEAERHRLEVELDSRHSHAAQLDAGQQLLDTGDARDALRKFEIVMTAYPSSMRARELADACRAQARDQEARDQRAAELTASARRAFDAGDWAAAIAKCDEALAVVPRHEPAASLRTEAQQAIVRERRRQEALLQRLVDRAGRAIDQRDFEDAEAALKEAEALRHDAPGIVELRRRLTEARAVAEAAELLRQMSAEETRRARAAFRRGRYDEAVQQLRAFLDVEPGAEEAEAELEQLLELRERLAASAAARQGRVLELLTAARSLAEQRMLAEALTQTRAAMHVDPGNPDAAALFDDLMERDLKQRIASARARALEQRHLDAAPLLTAARDALARGYLAVGLEAAVAACRVAPERPDAAALVDEVRRDIAAEDEEMVELGALPMPEPPAERPPADVPRTPPDSGGVLSHVNQWAADLLRRRPAKS